MNSKIVPVLALGISIGACAHAVRAGDAGPIDFRLARQYFDEAEALSRRDAGRLWNKPLYGPMMFADHATRTVVADRADRDGNLRQEKDVFVGKLPPDHNIANTAFTWAGVEWTMVVWPPPADPLDRGVLLMHELWHRIQADLGLPSTGPDNAHLDTPDGRTWMRLEWAALRKALHSQGVPRRGALEDALIFRAHRRSLFSGAAAEEQSLEMHEGLANYTGAAVAGSNASERLTCALRALESGEKKPTYVRSFAYASGPAYGVLLDELASNWRTGISAKNDLGELASRAIHFVAPGDIAAKARERAGSYGGDRITAEETERDRERRRKLASARAKLVDGPILRLPFRQMKIQLDPNGLIPLGELGTVYPTARIVDEWGVLTVTDGALIDKNWSGVTVAAPADLTAAPLSGPGWTLSLSDGWSVVAINPTSFQLQRNP